MLKVHMSNGLTHEVDLADESQFNLWLDRFHDPVVQHEITGLTVVQRGAQYSIPRPTGFQETALMAEPLDTTRGGERIILVTEGVKVQMVVHAGQRAARVAVSKRNWRQVYKP